MHSPSAGAGEFDDTGTRPPPFEGAGYVIEDGRAGVVAGYVERPEPVTTIDTGRRSVAARRVCGWFDHTAEFTFAPAPTSTLRDGVTYVLACRATDTDALVYADFRTWIPGRPGGEIITTPDDLITYTRNLFDLDPPATLTAPPADTNIVGVAAWFGHPPVATQTRSAQAGPLWATATATPTSVTYTTTTGTDRPPRTTTCNPIPPPPATDTPPPDCATATWYWSGTHTIEATITYTVTVTTGDLTNGSTSGPSTQAPLTGPTATTTVTVRELVTVIR
jgi:hypothetical protein